MQVAVQFESASDGEYLTLDGGHPSGGDSLHSLVGTWPGWRRTRRIGQLLGWPSSRYQARAWPSAMIPLANSRLAIQWAPGAREQFEARLEQMRQIQLVAEREPKKVRLPAGREMMPHQVQAFGALQQMGNVALFTDDMGLGKTTTSLAAWWVSGKARLLVVCPKSVKLNWLVEIEACLGPIGFTVYLIDGTLPQRTRVLSYMHGFLGEKGDSAIANRAIAIVNYDLLHGMNELHKRTLRRWVDGQAVICDEFHYCKEQKTKRSKAVHDLLTLAPFRLGMTGTPVRNTVEDLFNQVEMLRPGTWVNYNDFADRHLVRSHVQFGGGKKQVLVTRGGKNLEDLARVMNTLRFGRKKEDVLTLPPKVHTKPRLELDGAHLEVYQTIKREALIQLEKLVETGAQVEDLTVFHPLARSAVEASMRCEMVAQGFISGLPPEYAKQVAPLISNEAEQVPDMDAFVFPQSSKLRWVLDTIEDLLLAGQPVVVFSRFNAPLVWMASRQEKSVLLTGSLNAIQRQRAIDHFMTGQSRVMFCQVKLAEGFNLTCAQDVIFLGRDWSPAINAQAEARCHRIGTKGTVNIQIPIVMNSVERLIDTKLAAKEADAEQAMKYVTIRELIEAL